MRAFSYTGTAALVAATLAALGGAPAAPALEQGDILVRARAIYLTPDDDSGTVSAGGAPIAGSGVSVDNAASLDLDFTYMFTRNIGAELLLNVSSKHDVSSEGTLATVLPGDIVETRVLPPTLLLQYHFLPDEKIRPYVGAGVNYTIFFNEKAKGNGVNVAGMNNVSLKNSWGLAGQVGADFDLGNDWFFNVDVKYIDINTTAKANSALGDIRVDVDIDPWVFGIGIGTRF